jgi:hypothetical protein
MEDILSGGEGERGLGWLARLAALDQADKRHATVFHSDIFLASI